MCAERYEMADLSQNLMFGNQSLRVLPRREHAISSWAVLTHRSPQDPQIIRVPSMRMDARHLKVLAVSTGEIVGGIVFVDLVTSAWAEWTELGVKHGLISKHVSRFGAKLGGQQRMVHVSAEPELHAIGCPECRDIRRQTSKFACNANLARGCEPSNCTRISDRFEKGHPQIKLSGDTEKLELYGTT